ncbi:MAG: hypothetical protein ACR2GC_10520 [Methyloceanibacter sp.]|uniref:hypothetical protein n=1 Tax=Methyloceanibacter sp. TaxID=1965321 RepID=UPI003D9BF02C
MTLTIETARVFEPPLARYRDQASDPLPFSRVKAAAVAMATADVEGDRLTNPITYLNKHQARIEDLRDYVPDRRGPVIDLLNVGAKYKRRIVETACGGDTTVLACSAAA